MTLRRRARHLAWGIVLACAAPAAWAQTPDAGGLPFETRFTVKPSPELAARVPERMRAAGVITVVTNPNTPPTVYVGDDNRTLAGREIDIMSAVAHRLGLEPRWVNAGAFGNIVPGLASARYDAALANLGATQDRLKQVDFVSYFSSNRLGLVRAAASFSGTPITDVVALCGETVGAGSGTSNADVLREAAPRCQAAGKPPIDIKLFPSRPAGVQAVVSGRVPSFFGPYEGLAYTASASHGALVLAGTVQVVPGDFVSIGLQKDSPLTPLVAAALNSLIADGTYTAILRRWDLEFGAIPEAKQNGAILAGSETAGAGK